MGTQSWVALAIFAGTVFWWNQPGTAQTKAPSEKESAVNADLLRRLQDLEQKVQDLQQKLEEKEKREAAPAPAPKAEEHAQPPEEKGKSLEPPKENEKGEPAAKVETPAITWKDGFIIKTPDNQFKLTIGAWVLYDYAYIRQDESLREAVGKERDATGFRSARLRLTGTMYDYIDCRLEIDLVGKDSNAFNSPAFYDTYLQVHDIPSLGGETGRLRVGNFREPFSMEELSQLPRLTFVERSLANVFAPARNVGAQWSDALLGDPGHERMTYAVGVFKTANTFGASSARGYSVTGRVTGLPWYEDEGEAGTLHHMLHLGAAYSHREPDGAVLGWNARPESQLAQFRYVNADATVTGFRLRDARAETVDEVGLEAALVYGPCSLQGEYDLAAVKTDFDGTRSFSGYYVQAGYFLTGEHRAYRNADGVFDRVYPIHDFSWRSSTGWGAWEVALRYSSIDLDSGAVRGGKQANVTVGTNWYFNPNTRLTLNYIYNDVKHDLYKGTQDTFQGRFGVDF